MLRWLRLHRFRSFRRRTRIDFPQAPGLYHVAGDNGAGKSTVFDAVAWCLYGRTAADLAGPDVRTWGLDEGVEVEVAIDDRVIKRTWSPNTLTLDDRPVTQDEIDAALGRSFDQYLLSTHHGQFSDSFLDLSRGDKTSVLTTALRLDEWEQRSERARVKAQRLEHDMAQHASKRDRAAGEINAIESVIGTYETSRDKHAQWRVRIESELQQAQRDVDDERLAWASSSDRCEAQQRGVNELRDRVESLRRGIDQLKSISEQAAREVAQCTKDLERANGASCSLCGAKLSQDKAAEHAGHRAKLVKQREAAIQAQGDAADLLLDQEQALGLAEVEWKAALKRLGELGAEVVNNARALSRATDTVSLINGEYKEGLRAHEELLMTMRDARDRLFQARRVMRDEQDWIDDLRLDHIAIGYWVKGFIELSLFQMHESLGALEALTNDGIEELGLPGWSIEFGTEETLKTGKMKRGFNVQVRSPVNAKSVPFKSWSGGEAQRLRLASSIAIADLIDSGAYVQLGFEVWDEPTTWVKQDGIDALLAALHRRAQQWNKQVWLIDHHVLHSGEFDQTFKVRKENGTSKWE